MWRLFMPDEHLDIVHLLATDRTCQGQLIVRKRGDLVSEIKSVKLRPFGKWHLHRTFPEHVLGCRIKDEKVAALSATMTASPIFDKMDWRISFVSDSCSAARFRSIIRPNCAATATITLTNCSFWLRASRMKNSRTAMTLRRDKMGIATPVFR